MKTTRMTVEGAKGWANIAYRDVAGKQVIGIRGDGAAGVFDLSIDTRDEQSQRYAAARLQRELDGYQGTAGDVAEYLRAIQTFADQGDQNKEQSMKTAARQTENVMGKRLRLNDVVIRGGYEWVIDRITFEPDFPRYVCTCHWSGNGADPQFFNNNFDTAQRDDIPWTRVVNPRPRRLVCRTEAPAWYATQAGRKVELRQTGTDEVLATIRPPTAWGDAWGWNLIDGGVLVEHTGRPGTGPLAVSGSSRGADVG